MRWLLPLVSVLVLTGCPPAPCGPDTCDGCCSEGECLHDTTVLHCGLGGVACAVCRSTQVCTALGCRTPPDAGTAGDGGAGCSCPLGCCGADGVCRSGTTPDACGARHSTCQVCAAGERCDNATCVSSPCPGCIDSLGHCQSGLDAFACGADAGLCLSCPVDQGCVAGACRPSSCTAATCTGCCTASQTCVSGTSNAQCGHGGAACISCPASQTCFVGSCS